MAGAVVGLFTSMLLHIANHPEDFLYLYDARNYIKTQLTSAKKTLNEYGKKYRTRRELVVEGVVEPV
jgi:hypothetical protein